MPIYEYACADCAKSSSLLIRSFTLVEKEEAALHCPHCHSKALSRIPSRPSRIQVTRTASEASSALQAIDPRKAVESMSRQYDQAGIDPGRGFAEVAKRAAAGDAPGELKEAVQAARTETR